MEIPNTEGWRFTDVRFLPIVREYAKRINLFRDWHFSPPFTDPDTINLLLSFVADICIAYPSTVMRWPNSAKRIPGRTNVSYSILTVNTWGTALVMTRFTGMLM